jgi:hypothetical protein
MDEREEYDLEGSYLQNPESFHGTLRAVFRCAARWATSYECKGSGRGFPPHGLLPLDRAARRDLVDQVFDAFEYAQIPPYGNQSLALLRGEEAIYVYHEGIGRLRLAPHEFALIQDCFGRSGLPRDLFFPRHAYRKVWYIEQKEGETSINLAKYTPRWWKQLIAEGGAQIAPSEAEWHHALHRLSVEAASVIAARLARARMREQGPSKKTARRESLLAQVSQLGNYYGRRLGLSEEAEIPTTVEATTRRASRLLRSDPMSRLLGAVHLRLDYAREVEGVVDPEEVRELEFTRALLSPPRGSSGSI